MTVKEKRRNAEAFPISLPTERNDPPSSLSEYAITLYGEKGIGKSSLAAMFPDPITLMWEPRRRNLAIFQVPKPGEPPLTWRRHKKYIDKIIESGQFKTCIIDTVDRAYAACLESICYDKGISNPSDANDWGATWDLIKAEFEEVQNRLLIAGITPIYTSHARLRDVSNKATGETYQQVTPTCKDAAFQYLKACTDVALYYGYHNGHRSITVRGNDMIWSACGLNDHFLSQKGNQISTIYMGDSPEEGYENLMLAYDNRISKSKIILVSEMRSQLEQIREEEDEEEQEVPRKKKIRRQK